MKIADIELGEKPLLLAPMEDVTDPSFRYMCKRFGADVVYTEFISSDGLIRDAAKSLKKLEIDDAERPVGIQIYGHLIEPMVEAARMAEAADADIIDINFGCPVKKIAGRGAGSGMMRDVPLMVEMTRQIVRAVRKPVTVKTRLGWDDESKNIEEIALRLQDVGIAALTIHGRTRAQMYTGEADWTLIGRVKNNPAIHIPIIGNGDVDSGPRAAEMFDRYGVDGVMIGRATYGRCSFCRTAYYTFCPVDHNLKWFFQETVSLIRMCLCQHVSISFQSMDQERSVRCRCKVCCFISFFFFSCHIVDTVCSIRLYIISICLILQYKLYLRGISFSI